MKNQTHFRAYAPDQMMLLPPHLGEWLPEGHLVYFIRDIVRQLDLGGIYGKYDGSRGGHPPYDPEMMVSLLLYGYCTGLVSSRKIERATQESVPFRVLAANQHPDHDTVAEFRRRHLRELAGLFFQVLQMCQKAGLVKLGHVALDGTKVRANASKHKAMSYGRMEKSAADLEADIQRLLEAAEAADEEEDRRYGKDCRGDELPEELQFKEKRLQKIKEAKAALEDEARERAAGEQKEYERKRADWEKRRGRRGRSPKPPSDTPSSKAQRNFTDPESRIMKDGATKSFEQSYNAQLAVDEKAQVIVASRVTQAPVDSREARPTIELMRKNLKGKTPDKMSMDAGYWSEANAHYLQGKKIDGYIAPQKEKRNRQQAPPRGRIPKGATIKERMARKLKTVKGHCIYALRKQIVEPVFGQIKEARGFRRFSFRGLQLVQQEWDMVCLTHNILKLFRSGYMPAPA